MSDLQDTTFDKEGYLDKVASNYPEMKTRQSILTDLYNNNLREVLILEIDEEWLTAYTIMEPANKQVLTDLTATKDNLKRRRKILEVLSKKLLVLNSPAK